MLTVQHATSIAMDSNKDWEEPPDAKKLVALGKGAKYFLFKKRKKGNMAGGQNTKGYRSWGSLKPLLNSILKLTSAFLNICLIKYFMFLKILVYIFTYLQKEVHILCMQYLHVCAVCYELCTVVHTGGESEKSSRELCFSLVVLGVMAYL